MAPYYHCLLVLFLASPLALAQRTVSIDDDIPSNAHSCIDDCLIRPYHSDPDLGEALQCGDPYEDECYCATITASASAASRHINECASSHCAPGDLTRDISSMRGIYASYCIGAGFTQPIVSAWYTAGEGPDDSASATGGSSSSLEEDDKPAPSTSAPAAAKETSSPDDGKQDKTETETETEEEDLTPTLGAGPGDATTKVTLVTSTGEPDEDDEEDVASRAVIEVTSIVYVNPKASDSSSSGPGDDGGIGISKAALGAILGVGIPLVLAIVGVIVWIILRRRKNQQQQQQQQQDGSIDEKQGGITPPTGPPTSRIDRKPVAVSAVSAVSTDAKTELSGQSASRELSGREIHPFPSNDPSPPLTLPGQHEMLAATDRPHEMGHRDPRYELQGQQRDVRYELNGVRDARYEMM
ncbi:hypothetical protein ACO1O0_006664 [Amphichorda felina]